MDLEKLAVNFGLPGLMLAAIVLVVREWMKSIERIEAEKRKVDIERVKVEDKKADAMASALTSLSGKIDAHHTVDIQSHTSLATEIAELHGKVDQALASNTPVRGVPIGGYGPHRPKSQGDR